MTLNKTSAHCDFGRTVDPRQEFTISFAERLVRFVALPRQNLPRLWQWCRDSLLRRCAALVRQAPGNGYLAWMLHGKRLLRLTLRHPRLLYKHLDAYAMSDLDPETRLRLVRGHYEYLRRVVEPEVLKRLAGSTLLLWKGEGGCSIRVGLPHKKAIEWEGELCLTLWQHDLLLYHLVFIIVPDKVQGVTGTPCLLITAVQGRCGMEEVRSATLACNDIQPAHLLVAALGGFAAGLGGLRLVGVGDARQMKPNCHPAFSYDRFFAHYSSGQAEAGLFQMDGVFADRLLFAKSPAHRKRTRKKRAYRLQLAQIVAYGTRGLLIESGGTTRMHLVADSNDGIYKLCIDESPPADVAA